MKAPALKKPAQPVKFRDLSKTGVVLPSSQRFEYTVANRAQGLLKANYDRLNTEQTHYTQDTNPKSDRWQQL